MRVFLDHNATSPVRPEVVAAVSEALAAGGNPSSVHASGRAARARVEAARSLIARSVCARAEDLVFTSGGTEANNLAIHAAKAMGATKIICSAIEHEAVVKSARASGLPVETLPVSEEGLADLAWLEARLAQADGETLLVALMAANNETGVIQPIVEAGRLVREAGHVFHVDAVQMSGKAAFDFAASGAQFAALSAHKTGGPQGVGALVTACDAQPGAMLHGGGQEKNRRAGTENVAGIVGFAAAIEAAHRDGAGIDRVRALRDRLEARLKDAHMGVRIWGASSPRLPNTTCLTSPGWPSEIPVIGLDLAGFEVSAGSACSSGKVKKSAVLQAMGASDDEAGTALRVSFGWNNDEADADRFADAWLKEYARVRPRVATAV